MQGDTTIAARLPSGLCRKIQTRQKAASYHPLPHPQLGQPLAPEVVRHGRAGPLGSGCGGAAVLGGARPAPQAVDLYVAYRASSPKDVMHLERLYSILGQRRVEGILMPLLSFQV